MVKLLTNKRILTIQIATIIAILTYYFWTSLGLTVSNYLMITMIAIVFFGVSFALIFAGINEAKNIKKKFMTGLIGNIILSTLFLAALLYVVLTMN